MQKKEKSSGYPPNSTAVLHAHPTDQLRKETFDYMLKLSAKAPTLYLLASKSENEADKAELNEIANMVFEAANNYDLALTLMEKMIERGKNQNAIIDQFKRAFNAQEIELKKYRA